MITIDKAKASSNNVSKVNNVRNVKNCACGELIEDCAYPNCDSGDKMCNKR